MRSVLELFGYAEQTELPLFVLSDGSAAYVSIVSSLRSAGFNAQAALPDIKELKVPNEIGPEVIYEYRVPIGLGLMALEAREDELNIFERLYSPAGKEEKKHWVYSLKVACAIVVVMLVLSVVVCFAIDVASSGAIEKRLKTSGSEADINLLMQRQKLIKAVAQERPDLLDLLGQVTASGESGIKLESFHFKKGQPVTITGQASNNEQLYKFEKSLQDRKNIKSVKMNPSRDTKTKKSKFTITFHYRNFTK
jgi:Tfp pilus assembly protein PilN